MWRWNWKHIQKLPLSSFPWCPPEAWHLHNGFLLYFFFPANWVRTPLLNRTASRNLYQAWKEENVCFSPCGLQNTEVRSFEIPVTNFVSSSKAEFFLSSRQGQNDLSSFRKKKDLMEQIYFCSIQLYFQGHHPWQSVVIGDLQWYVKSDRSLQQFYLRACEGCLFPQILELPGSGLNERTSWSCHLCLRIRSRLWWSILVPGASVKPAKGTEQFFRVGRRRSGEKRGRRENFRRNCS